MSALDGLAKGSLLSALLLMAAHQEGANSALPFTIRMVAVL